MSKELECTQEVKEVNNLKIFILRVQGFVDGQNLPEFRSAIIGLTTREEKSIILNFGGLNYINSTGFGLLATAFRTKTRKGDILVVSSLTEKVRHIFNLLGFDRIIPVYNTESEAIEAILKKRS